MKRFFKLYLCRTFCYWYNITLRGNKNLFFYPFRANEIKRYTKNKNPRLPGGLSPDSFAL